LEIAALVLWFAVTFIIALLLWWDNNPFLDNNVFHFILIWIIVMVGLIVIGLIIGIIATIVVFVSRAIAYPVYFYFNL